MPKTKRLFLAIKVNPQLNFIEQFNALKKDLNHESIKWVSENNLHLTLKFFGETDVKNIEGIVEALAEVLDSQQTFKLELQNIGIFGSSYQPKLIWAGVASFEELRSLWKNIRLQLQTLGYQSDRQNFVPHLTLGRIRKLSDKSFFQNIIKKYSEIKLQKLVVEKITLFESVLKPSGPIYQIIEEFPMKS